MDFAFPPEDTAFRQDARAWLAARLPPGAPPPAPRAWERELGRGGWIGLGWPEGEAEYGNRRATLTQQVVWAEEYARFRAPARIGHIGENLLAPTLLAFGTPAQRARFLPPIARGEELWCQGYSEPGAGSDLASVRTAATAVRDTATGATAVRDTATGATAVRDTATGATAVRDTATGGPAAYRPAAHRTTAYRVTGQKIWTSLAQEADWCFVLARTTPGSRRHHGLSFLLVPMDQPGRIEVRPIRQMTGDADFNEVFFDGAHASADHVVGGEGDGWRVAMGLLALERGVSTLAQQIGFAEELSRIVREAVRSGAAARDPVLRDRLVRQWAELRTMRWNALRTLGGTADPGAPSVAKLLWGGWRQRLGELAMAVRGPAAAAGPADWSRERPYELDALQRLFLFSRADTIYGGSDEIQRTIIAERVLGLPREPR
ncbi:acyl-CoA dehydrogenase family protein [Streptomyces sp. PR69]|uniref:acyl-CoA dehydrogenase family protein n=1 Tax=Streptomyces sp. PR69 TaxID=2984950 RepID=UPI0022645773|nr:acyl-CoA dehydrogenase family protein [Streptomyces sp. PR69]